jgi:hypothetical protein
MSGQSALSKNIETKHLSICLRCEWLLSNSRPDSVVAALARLADQGEGSNLHAQSLGSGFNRCFHLSFWLHPHAARLLYGRKAEDTFATYYRMNTRRCLRAVFERGGFTEAAFVSLDNCTTFQRFRLTCLIELALVAARQIGLTYPL